MKTPQERAEIEEQGCLALSAVIGLAIIVVLFCMLAMRIPR